MAFNWRKIFHPVATDLFAPHVHMKQLADSASVIIPVANTQEMTEVGQNATPESPVFVHVEDAPAGRKTLYTTGNGAFLPVGWGTSAANRSVATRRTDTGTWAASAGMQSLASASLGPLAPPGIYLVTWTWKLSCSTSANANLRGTVNGQVVTDDEPVSVDTTTRMFTLQTRIEHAGGQMTLVLLAQVGAGNGTAPAGSRITCTWQGPH